MQSKKSKKQALKKIDKKTLVQLPCLKYVRGGADYQGTLYTIIAQTGGVDVTNI